MLQCNKIEARAYNAASCAAAASFPQPSPAKDARDGSDMSAKTN